MASSTSAAGISSVVLLACLLALSIVSTDAQNSTVNSTNSDSSSRPRCPVQGDNYCVCAEGSCSGCAACAGCDDKQCVSPPTKWTGQRPSLSRAAAGELNDEYS
jgi:hypothetical protein